MTDRLNVVLDVDGCIFDFVGRWFLHVGIPYGEQKDPTSWNFYEDYGYTRGQFRGHLEEMARTSAAGAGYTPPQSPNTVAVTGRNPHLHPTVDSFFQFLNDEGIAINLFVNSHRPDRAQAATMRHVQDLMDWLCVDYTLEGDIVSPHHNKVDVLPPSFQADNTIVIEDAPHNIRQYANWGYHVLVPDHPYNGPEADGHSYHGVVWGLWAAKQEVRHMLATPTPDGTVTWGPPTVAARDNSSKPPMENLGHFRRGLEGLAHHAAQGQLKYADTEPGVPNWTLGGKPDGEYIGAIIRHALKLAAGEWYDKELGSTHADAIAWNATVLTTCNHADKPHIDPEWSKPADWPVNQ